MREGAQLCGEWFWGEWDVSLFSFSSFRNWLVRFFPAGLFCLLKAAPPQQLVERKIFCHSGNNTFAMKVDSRRRRERERERRHVAGSWRKKIQQTCLRELNRSVINGCNNNWVQIWPAEKLRSAGSPSTLVLRAKPHQVEHHRCHQSNSSEGEAEGRTYRAQHRARWDEG